jgi:hypothetical protein
MSSLETQLKMRRSYLALQRSLGLATEAELLEEKNIPNVIFGTGGAIVVLPSPCDSIEQFVIDGQQFNQLDGIIPYGAEGSRLRVSDRDDDVPAIDEMTIDEMPMADATDCAVNMKIGKGFRPATDEERRLFGENFSPRS